MSETLTEVQEKTVDAYGLEMLKNGVKCGSKTNPKHARNAVEVFYKKYLELPLPEKIVYVDSPEAAIEIVAKSTGKAPKDLVSEVQFINFWTWWVAYYHAGIHILKENSGVEPELISDLDEYEKIIQEIHAVLPCEKVCFVIEYPKAIHLQDNDLEKFKLHKDGGLALEYLFLD